MTASDGQKTPVDELLTDDDTLLFDRELSWLSFNGRVLQEAADATVPLVDRLAFIGIVSSNLDEFFRVRVARLRTILRLKKKQRLKFGIAPKKLLRAIRDRVDVQQVELGRTLRSEILPALEEEGIRLVDDRTVSRCHLDGLRRYFAEEVSPLLEIRSVEPGLFLEDHRLYLAVSHRKDAADEETPTHCSLIRLPSPELPRCVAPPKSTDEGTQEIIFLDDVVRLHLGELFEGESVLGCYSVKLTRDAELYLEDELEGDVAEKVRRSLKKRLTGVASRFLFDADAPDELIESLRNQLDLREEDLLAGWRYHNLADLMAFPGVGGDHPRSKPLPALQHPQLTAGSDPFSVIHAADQLLELPYQSFDAVLHFLNSAASDEAVRSICISLYRVAGDSSVARALIKAAERGAKVTAFVEVQARFDEATNLDWAERMTAAGVRVLTSREGLKVHAKVALVEREEADGLRRYAYLGTGNFNEKSARVYADLGLFTARPEVTGDVRRVFDILDGGGDPIEFESLLVAPAGLRHQLLDLVEGETVEAKAGRPARIVLKLNSLEDPAMIEALYGAASAGVEVDLIVRGICCLIPDQPQFEGRIRVRSIVDRFLEHARIMWFHARGEELVFVGSADWMTRNLDRRVEVVFPVLDETLAERVRSIARLQLADNLKARIIAGDQSNSRVERGDKAVRSQLDHYHQLAD